MKRSRLALLLAAAFLVKLVAVLQMRGHPLTQPDAGLDTSVYTGLAYQVLGGNYALGPGLYFVSPLYIYFVAASLAVVNAFTFVRCVQIALGTAAVGCVFVATRAWFGGRAAWIAASLAALTGVFTFNEALLLQSALDPFLTAASLAALAIAFTRRGSLRWFFVAGVLFGIQTLNRPNVLIPAAAMTALLLVGRRWRPAVLLSAGIVLALVPVTARNFVVAGDWSPVSSHGGLNFYIGNNAEADGTYRQVPGITPDISGQQADARRVAERAVGRPLDDAEVSAYFYGQGWSWIAAHPKQALALFARKIAYTFNAVHIALNYSYPFYAYDARTILAALFVGPWLLAPLGLVGLVAAAPRQHRFEYVVWCSFVPLYAIAVAIFFVSDRYRLPLLVPLCAGAGAGIDWALRRFRLKPDAAREESLEATRGAASESRGFRLQAAAAAAAFILLAVFANWPTGLDDGRAEERTRMAEAMIASGRYDEADAWTRKAEQGNPDPGLLQFRIGRALLAQRKAEAAVAHLQRALQLDPTQPAVDYALGQALVDAGRPADAVPHLRKALDAGVRVDLAGFDLARALGGSGDREGALRVLQTVRPSNAGDAQSWDTLGELALQLQAPPLAAEFFRQAVAAAPRASKPRRDLGLALAMMGRYADAIASFEQAVLLDPSDPAAQLNLAVAYAQTGRVDDARAHAEEALRLKPDYERARQFLAALK